MMIYNLKNQCCKFINLTKCYLSRVKALHKCLFLYYWSIFIPKIEKLFLHINLILSAKYWARIYSNLLMHNYKAPPFSILLTISFKIGFKFFHFHPCLLIFCCLGWFHTVQAAYLCIESFASKCWMFEHRLFQGQFQS